MSVTRQLAWDGVTFNVPVNWELARYYYPDRRQGLIEVEDEASRRLELEWIRSPSERQRKRFVRRIRDKTERLTVRADRHVPVPGLAPHWQAEDFEFREILPVRRRTRQLGIVRHNLVSAVCVPPGESFRCFMRLHFLHGDPEEPVGLTRQITHSFEHAIDRDIRWKVFDLDFELSPEFALEATAFDIGAKLMVFRRNGRRLFCWTLSCVDCIKTLFEDSVKWVVGFLNGQRRVDGIVFFPDRTGGIGWRRRRLLAMVNRDELARRCLKYVIGFRHDRERNQLVIWVFNYRQPTDLAWIRRYPGS